MERESEREKGRESRAWKFMEDQEHPRLQLTVPLQSYMVLVCMDVYWLLDSGPKNIKKWWKIQRRRSSWSQWLQSPLIVWQNVCSGICYIRVKKTDVGSSNVVHHSLLIAFCWEIVGSYVFGVWRFGVWANAQVGPKPSWRTSSCTRWGTASARVTVQQLGRRRAEMWFAVHGISLGGERPRAVVQQQCSLFCGLWSGQ